MALTVGLVGVPSALGAPEPGPERGPDAIRAAGVVQRLQALGVTVQDLGNVPVDVHGAGGVPALRGTEVVGARARDRVQLALAAELFPILIGGEHCAAWGTIAGAAKAYPELGVLWIDAHPDFNTFETTLTQNPHGMVLAVAAGLGPPAALKRLGRTPLVDPTRIAVLGARSIDPGEGDLLVANGIRSWTTAEVLELGAHSVVEAAAASFNAAGAKAVHVSVDLDVLDPLRWPGVSTPVDEGISLQDLITMVTAAIHELNVVSLDVMELNPAQDVSGSTVEAAIQVIEAAARTLAA